MTFYLGLAIHNHQPVGNFPCVIEEAYQKAYLPMLEALERHPLIRLSLHNSGPLIDWFQEHRPGDLRRLGALVRRGQVEPMTGGYFEPILPAIPERDKVGQIEKLSRALEGLFGVRPTGLWLTERVWEPSLPRPLHQAGVEWTVVDDIHFKMVGLEEGDLLGYRLTEEEGPPLRVFSSLKALRYSIPWKTVPQVMDYLRSLAEAEPGHIAVMGDDGEKFGVWPGTYKHCWEEGWVEEFLSAIEESASWLTPIPLGEYATSFPPLGNIYLPCASYDEMLEWALPTQKTEALEALKREFQGRPEVLDFLRGGFWRHFLVKYPEANWLHKRMLRTHRLVYRALEKGVDSRDDLWRAQSSCTYWHGIFGGLYLADLRAVAYHHLLRAERQGLGVLGPSGWEREDVDLDGREEVVYEGRDQTLFFRPGEGGALGEWDLHRPAFNLLSTLARRPEAYHRALLERGGEEGGLKSIHDLVRIKEKEVPIPSYDPFPRTSALEHFLEKLVGPEAFGRGEYADAGDFAGGAFKTGIAGRRLVLRREGRVGDQPLLLEKAFTVRDEGFDVEYRLEYRGSSSWRGVFLSEWNLNLLGGGHNPQAYFQAGEATGTLDSRVELKAEAIVLGNHHLGVELKLALSQPARLWLFPVEALSNSEQGVEKVYQGTCLAVFYPVELRPGQGWGVVLRWQAGTEER
ncbi:MAG TPA: alpha-amylase/4-alpha-glucanotransferase domain-containing protein [Dehalococcoidia bacterium]|nr:alpha-amylase/4-alpha-glucanotransferase domain-containing protein [Dehalococcoidia bacterium]